MPDSFTGYDFMHRPIKKGDYVLCLEHRKTSSNYYVGYIEKVRPKFIFVTKVIDEDIEKCRQHPMTRIVEYKTFRLTNSQIVQYINSINSISDKENKENEGTI